MQIKFFFVIVAISLNSYAIINGQLVKEGDYKEVVAISGIKSKFDDSELGNCTGVLVAPTLVVTSAHCVTSSKFNAKGAQVTQINEVRQANRSNDKMTVLRSESYPEYDRLLNKGESDFKKTQKDIGYILIDKPFSNFKSNFNYILKEQINDLLSISNNHFFEGKESPENLKIVSYGPGKKVREDLNFYEFGIKREATVKLSKMSYDVIQHNSSKDGVAAAPGDSGSPVMLFQGEKKFLLSITSRTDNQKSENTFFSTILSREKICWVQQASKVKIENLICD